MEQVNWPELIQGFEGYYRWPLFALFLFHVGFISKYTLHSCSIARVLMPPFMHMYTVFKDWVSGSW